MEDDKNSSIYDTFAVRVSIDLHDQTGTDGRVVSKDPFQSNYHSRSNIRFQVMALASGSYLLVGNSAWVRVPLRSQSFLHLGAVALIVFNQVIIILVIFEQHAPKWSPSDVRTVPGLSETQYH